MVGHRKQRIRILILAQSADFGLDGDRHALLFARPTLLETKNALAWMIPGQCVFL